MTSSRHRSSRALKPLSKIRHWLLGRNRRGDAPMTHAPHAPEAVARAASFDLPAGSWPLVSRDAAEGRADVVTVCHDPEGGWWFGSASEAELVPQCLPCVLTRH